MSCVNCMLTLQSPQLDDAHHHGLYMPDRVCKQPWNIQMLYVVICTTLSVLQKQRVACCGKLWWCLPPAVVLRSGEGTIMTEGTVPWAAQGDSLREGTATVTASGSDKSQ